MKKRRIERDRTEGDVRRAIGELEPRFSSALQEVYGQHQIVKCGPTAQAFAFALSHTLDMRVSQSTIRQRIQVVMNMHMPSNTEHVHLTVPLNDTTLYVDPSRRIIFDRDRQIGDSDIVTVASYPDDQFEEGIEEDYDIAPMDIGSELTWIRLGYPSKPIAECSIRIALSEFNTHPFRSDPVRRFTVHGKNMTDINSGWKDLIALYEHMTGLIIPRERYRRMLRKITAVQCPQGTQHHHSPNIPDC